MGRQTAVALSEEDEREFLNFLRADADVRIYRWAAVTPEFLTVSTFPPRGPREWSYRLWNTAFAWEPEYDQWQPQIVEDPELASKFHLKNVAGAPLLEYSRHNFDSHRLSVYGRIYWNTDFEIDRGPAYDTVAFGHWYDHVVPWLRKKGNKVQITKRWCQYWLPGALAMQRDASNR
jgi:hypothetical protein